MPPKVYRSMLPTDDGQRPRIGNDAKSLGVRQLSERATVDDIPVVEERVHPETGGMSVNRSVPELPGHLIPKIHRAHYPDARGNPSLIAWKYGNDAFQSGQLANNLNLRIDPYREDHGFVEPAMPTSLADFRTFINATQHEWIAVNWLDGEASV